jgi:hypothetical protein
MGEQITRYAAARGDLMDPYSDPRVNPNHEKVVLASDHDAEIAQRDARIVELEKQVTAATELHIAMVNAAANVEAERDTAREMLVSARELLERANSGMLIQVIDDDEKMREYLVKAEAEQIKLFADIRVFLASLKE